MKPTKKTILFSPPHIELGNLESNYDANDDKRTWRDITIRIPQHSLFRNRPLSPPLYSFIRGQVQTRGGHEADDDGTVVAEDDQHDGEVRE